MENVTTTPTTRTIQHRQEHQEQLRELAGQRNQRQRTEGPTPPSFALDLIDDSSRSDDDADDRVVELRRAVRRRRHDTDTSTAATVRCFLFPDLDDLAYWSRPPPTPRTPNSTSGSSSDNMDIMSSSDRAQQLRQQGVLWKRRDVFKNRWRPRWFVLQPVQGILTYYLLTTESNNTSTNINTNTNAATTTTTSTAYSPVRVPLLSTTTTTTTTASSPPPSAASTVTGGGGAGGGGADHDDNNEDGEGAQEGRDRTASWDSAVSENTVDYDVVPRGTVYLVGCAVRENAALTKPEERLYAFTIYPPTATTATTTTISETNTTAPAPTAASAAAVAPSNQPQIHLAARTPQQRAIWIEKISRIASPTSFPDTTSLSSSLPTRRTSSSNSSGGREDNDRRQEQQRQSAQHEEPTPTRRNRTNSHPSTANNADNNNNDLSNLTDFPSPIDASSATNQRQGRQVSTSSSSTSTATAGNQQSSSSEWHTIGNPNDLYADLPESLQERICTTLKTNLALCEQKPDTSEWKILYRNETASAYQKRRGSSSSNTGTSASTTSSGSSPAMIKSVALVDHPPKRVFDLLVNVRRRGEIERNVSHVQILRVVNPYTLYTYYRYEAVWPASSRDFTVVTHWHTVRKGNETAIVLVSFSCDEADELKRQLDETNHHVGNNSNNNKKYVRGTLHVNLSLLRTAGGRDGDQCHFTRILSYSLGGGISDHFANVVISQQAGFPMSVEDVLHRSDIRRRRGQQVPDGPSSSSAQNDEVLDDDNQRFLGLITDEILIKDIVQRQTAYQEGEKIRRPSDKDDDPSTKRTALGAGSGGDESFMSENGDDSFPPIERVAVLLFAPLVAYKLATCVSAPFPGLCFLVCVWLALRELAILHEGEEVVWSEHSRLLGPVTCHFQVDLKGILRFIAHKKEERHDFKNGTADISVVHILACAVATALKKERALNVRRVSIPWLCLSDRFVQCGDEEPVSVSIWEKPNQIVTLDGADNHNVQAIADEVAAYLKSNYQDNRVNEPGSCMILAAPTYDNRDQFSADVIPYHPDIRVVAVVGGVHLDPSPTRHANSVSSSLNHRQQQVRPKPFLNMSITVAPGPQADFITCRRFVEEVQKLLQFPEMCD